MTTPLLPAPHSVLRPLAAALLSLGLGANDITLLTLEPEPTR